MRSLVPEDKRVIFDFFFRCNPGEDIDRAHDLMARDYRAAEVYSKLKAVLWNLDFLTYEPCPDNLAELTVARLKAASGQRITKKGKRRKLPDDELEKNKVNKKNKST